MANYTYTFQKYDEENMARGVVINAGISTKKTIEVCNYIRNKKISRVKTILQGAVDVKQAIPFKRFTAGVGHKPGIGAGKYPVKVCESILSLLNSVEKNAQNKGLNSDLLVITHINAHKGTNQMKQGRQGRRMYKRTTVEIVLGQAEEKDKKAGSAKAKPVKKREVPIVESMPVTEKQKEANPVSEKPGVKVTKTEPKQEIKEVPKSAPETKKVQPKQDPIQKKKEETQVNPQEGEKND